MDKFNYLVRQARTHFRTADHMAYVTYPVVGDTRMLIIVAENLYRSALKAVGAVLYYERLYKRIMNVPLGWDERLRLFEKVAPRYSISLHVSKTVRDLYNLMKKHKESPMAFARGDKFVITDEKFSLQTLDITLLKKYVVEIRTLVERVEAIKQ